MLNILHTKWNFTKWFKHENACLPKKRMNKTWLRVTYNTCQNHCNGKCRSSGSILKTNSNCKSCHSGWMRRRHSSRPKHPSGVPSLLFVPTSTRKWSKQLYIKNPKGSPSIAKNGEKKWQTSQASSSNPLKSSHNFGKSKGPIMTQQANCLKMTNTNRGTGLDARNWVKIMSRSHKW